MGEAEAPLSSLLGAISDLTAWFDDAQTAGVVIGGVAASILGRPRVTRDVDVVVDIPEESWTEFVESGARFGFAPRIPQLIQFALRSRVLLLRHVNSQIDIDISLAALPFEQEMISRSQRHAIGGLRLSLPQAEDLIVMKAIAHRPQDLRDIEAIAQVQEKLDFSRIHTLVKEFAEALETPEIYSDMRKALVTPGKPKT